MLSLRKLFLLLFALLVALPLAAFWLWPHSRALQSEFDEVRDRHLLLARNIGTALERHARDLEAAFAYSSEALLAGRPIPAPRALLSGLHIIAACHARLGDGGLIDAHVGSGLCPDVLPAEDLASDGMRPLGEGVFMSGVEKDALGGPRMRLVRRGGESVVVAYVDTSYFRQLGGSIRFGTLGHAVIVDPKGRVFAHPLNAWEREMKDISAVPVVRRMIAGETGIGGFYSPAMKSEMIAGFAAVSGTGWGVMVAQPVSDLHDKVSGITSAALAIFAMALIVSALVAFRAAMVIVDPLRSIAAGAREMEAGKENVSIAAVGRFAPSELKVLVASFNAMAASVSRARDQERVSRAHAEAANTSKTELLHTVAHELRSPLAGITGYARLISGCNYGPLGDERYAAAAVDIEETSQYLSDLTNDLLDLARVEAGQFILNEETVGIDEPIRRAIGLARDAAAKRRMTITTELASLPPVRADERTLLQCAMNLISNACRYGREGGMIRVETAATPTGGVALIVTDDGPGIERADLERVMKPFERVDNERSREVRGSGLGLPIVKRLTELHGGTFTLSSVIGEGTTARIELPAERVLKGERATVPSAA